MFSGLTMNTTIVNKTPVDINHRSEIRQILQAGMRHSNARAALTASIATMDHTTQDFSDMRQLRMVIRAYGLNRPLMEFVNPRNNVISTIIPNMPSNESLDLVDADQNDPRTTTALTGIDDALDTEPNVVADWVNNCADNVGELFVTTTEQIENLDNEVEHYLGVITDLDETETSPNGSVEAARYDCANDCINALIAMIPGLDVAVADPTDRDAMDAYTEKLNNIAIALGEHTGLCINSNNPHCLQMGVDEVTIEPKVATLGEHGYNNENVIELLQKTKSLLVVVNELLARKDEFVSRLQDTATFVSLIDNDVPPAIDDAISDENTDVIEALAGGNMTQADMVRCHVSSGLCCISAVLDTAVRVVHNSLDVAGCLTASAAPIED